MRSHALMLFLLAAAPAVAETVTAPSAGDDALVEKIVVRNQLFSVSHRFELGLNVGFSMLSQLTDHYTFDISFAYNLNNSFAIELLAGYAYSQHTSLADDVAAAAIKNSSKTVDDLSNLWEMTANGVVGLRWQPIYGKIGIFSELPIHFQFYVFAGVGGAWFQRTSVVICNHKAGDGTCDSYYNESKPGVLASFAGGFRFFIPVVGNHHSIKLEIRDYSYLDSFYVGVNRAAALTANDPTGGGTLTQAGITNLTQIHIGYTYIF